MVPLEIKPEWSVAAVVLSTENNPEVMPVGKTNKLKLCGYRVDL